jgi:hypothetical protein
MTNGKPTGRFVLLTAMAVAVAAPDIVMAQGQADNPNIPVQNRRQPDYRPLNLRAGSFFIAPQMSVEGIYDSNVFARNENEDSDIYTVLRPAIGARSDWSRHALNVGAALEAGLYSDFSDNNYIDLDANLGGRVDITRNDVITPTLSVSRGHEGRDDPESDRVGRNDDITQFWEYLLGASYRHDFNRFYGIVRGDVTRISYEEAGDVSNADRDRYRYRTGIRFGYKPVARFDGYIDAAYRWVRYDTSTDNNDNEAYILRAGVGVDITSILFGDLYVGYESVDYDADDRDDASTPIVGGELTWNVTPLTSIIFDSQVDIRETRVRQDGEQASGRLRADFALNVWHELLRNLLVNGFVQYVRDDFEGIDRTDDTYRLGTRLRYLVNRNFSLDGGYTFVTRDSDVADREYDKHVIRVGITAAL